MLQPAWYYKEVLVPELVDIQHELIKVLPQLVDPTEEVTFFYIDKEIIAQSSPSYVKMLQRMNLYNRWSYSAIVTTSGGKEFPIHVDSIGWEDRCYGLNLPLVNCENSYTVWYDAKIIDKLVTEEYDRRHSGRFCVAEGATEVCRMPATTTAWVNTSIPHRPETETTELRAIISARFSPEVHDYL